MLTLEDHESRVIAFLDSGLARFVSEKPSVVATTIALYSCPQTGWVSLCLNTGDTPETHADNCPDFTFVEYALLEVPEWQEEYESENPEVEIASGGRTVLIHLEEEGDDAYNKPLFDFLLRVTKEYFQGGRAPLRPVWAGVQMLDSEHASFWQP
jgi:hypothetical protein